jgi:hypothetical protein
MGYSAEEAAMMGRMTAADVDYNAEDAQIKARAKEIRKLKGDNQELIIEWAKLQGMDLTKKDISGSGSGKFKYKDADGKEHEVSYDTLAEDMARAEIKDFNSTSVDAAKYQK